MEKYVRKLFGLTVDKMEKVYREVKRAYYIDDIVEYIVEGNIIDEKEIIKVDLDYIVDKYISRTDGGIEQIYVLEDTVAEYFEANKSKFSTLNLDNL